MVLEGWLRDWLRDGWTGMSDLVWVEAARGGTAGAPDVFVPVGELYLPVELKAWLATDAGRVVFTARPAQRRFHVRAAMAGHRTAFLAVLTDGRVVAMRGADLPIDDGVGNIKLWSVETVEQLRELFHNPNFWGG